MFFLYSIFFICFLSSDLNCWWQQAAHKTAVPLVSTHITINNSNSYAHTEKLVKEVMQESRAQICSFYELLYFYKYRTIISLLAGSYSTITYQFFSLKNSLQEKTCWSLWLCEKSLEELLSIPQKQIGKQLLSVIQQAYIIEQNPADFVQPLMLFMKAIEQEKIYLERYSLLVDLTDKLYLGKIFLYDKELLKKIPDRLARLAYYKASFISWLGEYKYDKSSQKSLADTSLLKNRTPKHLSQEEKNAEIWKFIRDTE